MTLSTSASKPARRVGEPFHPVDDGDGVAFRLQRSGERLSDGAVVVGDQDVMHTFVENQHGHPR